MTTMIHKVEFVKSSPTYKECPSDIIPEYAFVGRSNVGKSSLINYLTGFKKLAKTSKQPGQTKLINHFIVNDSWYLVDLPGYGYARISKSEKNRFLKTINEYLRHRSELMCLFLLIDIRHNPQAIDLKFMRWLGKNKIPFALCFTKTDKLSVRQQEKNFNNYKDILLTEWDYLPPIFFTSIYQNHGRLDILAFIEETNNKMDAKHTIR